MPVTINDVDHVAALARLSFSDEEKKELMSQLNEILAFMHHLNSLDTTTVAPLTHVIALQNVFRDDVVKPGLSREEALKNAPAHTDVFFTVPNVIGDR